MAKKVVVKSAEPSLLKEINIAANRGGKTASIVSGTIRLLYYESIMEDSVRATVVFADSGNAVDNKTVLDGLPLCGSEKVNLKFADNNENELSLTMYVKKVTPLYDDTTKGMVELDLVSKEFLMNDKVRLNKRFDGKISDYVRSIFTDSNFLGSSKNIDIEPTKNTLNVIPAQWKPMYTINWLSKWSVGEKQELGVSAGYFFFETSEGYKFKSIDGLLSQDKKKSIIFNNTPDSRGENLPAGYDIKAIEYEKDNKVDIQSKFEMGAYSTRTIVFDPFNCYYEVINPISEQNKGSLKLGGRELPSECINREFVRSEKDKEFSRTQYMLIDRGTLPSGNTKQQIEKSKEPNFDPKRILNQSAMRYNQLFASSCNILIPGDFSLHAGDVVFFDAPPQNSEKNYEVNQRTGGLYIISDLCHYISPKETFTRLNLVRDSFGRKGNHTSGSI
jgi:hypothetical protein